LPTINPTWTDLDTNPGICGERLVTKLLSHGTASIVYDDTCMFIHTFLFFLLPCDVSMAVFQQIK
jgi:hypothetical protein